MQRYGVDKDELVGVQWLTRSSGHGDPDGQYHLSLMLLKGIKGTLDQVFKNILTQFQN